MKTFLYLLLLLPFASGNNHRADITSDWCRMNLKGEVKEMYGYEYLGFKDYTDSFYFNNYYYSFTTDGYIDKLSMTNLMPSIGFSDTIFYFDPSNKGKGYYLNSITRDCDINKAQYKVAINIKNDTCAMDSIYENNLSSNEPGANPFELSVIKIITFNKKHQLLSETICDNTSTPTHKTVYYYNTKGYINKQVKIDYKKSDTTITHKYVSNTDSYGNPILVISIASNNDTSYFSYSYTYY